MSDFSSLSPPLHPLLLRALSQLSFPKPTPIQAALIPHALSSSRDILARARTGSGKTLSYAIPIVQGILSRRDRGEHGGTRALVLVPTRELAEQVRGQVGKLIDGLGLAEGEAHPIRVVNVAGNDGTARKKRKAAGAGGERVERSVFSGADSGVAGAPGFGAGADGSRSWWQNATGGQARDRRCDAQPSTCTPALRGAPPHSELSSRRPG